MVIFWSQKLKLAERTTRAFQNFVQAMANRIGQGHACYGHPDPTKKYMTRAILELKAYKKSGNREHLYNTANYCFLEALEPEHGNSHINTEVESVTRGKI